jgi:hypothetical protein
MNTAEYFKKDEWSVYERLLARMRGRSKRDDGYRKRCLHGNVFEKDGNAVQMSRSRIS